MLETTLFVGKLPYKHIELIVSAHQLCILMQFNSTDTMKYGAILKAVKPKPVENDTKTTESGGEDLIKDSLLSLISKKYLLLMKNPEGCVFNGTDVFRLNTKFVSPKRWLILPTPAAKISKEEWEAADKKVLENRRHVIEAAIARVMKQYKTMEHQRLLMEVCTLCNPVFKPEPRAIKSRIEALIMREYLTRNYLAREVGRKSRYKYLA